MSRKLLATLLLVVVGTFAVPLAANADDYTSGGHCSISPSTATVGESATITCAPGTFAGSEHVRYLISGPDLDWFPSSPDTNKTLRTSDPDGGAILVVTVPSHAAGAYTITGTGETSHVTITATLTVIPADHPASSNSSTTSSGSGSGLADTGSVITTSLISVGIGLVLAGVVVVIIVAARRRREGVQR